MSRVFFLCPEDISYKQELGILAQERDNDKAHMGITVRSMKENSLFIGWENYVYYASGTNNVIKGSNF